MTKDDITGILLMKCTREKTTIKVKEVEFVTVILGGNITTYSLARLFHEENKVSGKKD